MNQLIGTQEFDNVVRSANQIIDAVSALLHPRDADGDIEGITPTVQELNVLAAIEIYKEALKLAGYGYAGAAPNDYIPAPPKRKRPKKQYTLMEPPEDDERRDDIVAQAIAFIDRGDKPYQITEEISMIFDISEDWAVRYLSSAMLTLFPARATDDISEPKTAGPYCHTSELTAYIVANCFPKDFEGYGLSTMARNGKIYVKAALLPEGKRLDTVLICNLYNFKFMGK